MGTRLDRFPYGSWLCGWMSHHVKPLTVIRPPPTDRPIPPQWLSFSSKTLFSLSPLSAGAIYTYSCPPSLCTTKLPDAQSCPAEPCLTTTINHDPHRADRRQIRIHKRKRLPKRKERGESSPARSNCGASTQAGQISCTRRGRGRRGRGQHVRPVFDLSVS